MASTPVAVLLLALLASLSGSSCGIKLNDNGYTQVLVAINPTVAENPLLIEKIKEMLTEGSKFLHKATRKTFYLKEVTILVPPNWKNGSYSRARTEMYDKANIVINQPNRAYGDNPYTLQYQQCGEPGQYIHFTPTFMLDDKLVDQYGLREKVFVHEWAHLRWGVYDEYNERQPFYLHKGKLEATRCSEDIEGIIGKLSNSALSCESDPLTGLPTEDCAFFPAKKQNSTASIMFIQRLSSVTDFCTKESHNILAPNMQNMMCGQKGAEKVIASLSVDREAANLPPIASPPPPAITVVQRKQRVVCLVLDVSGSMTGNRMTRQRQAATLFLEKIIEDQAEVGIVSFNSVPRILKHLTLIDGDASRKALVDALPKGSRGGTDICLGLKKALEELARDGNTSGDEIIFLTDGESSSMNCMNDVIVSKTTVNTIALGSNAHSQLTEMAEYSNGRFLLAPENADLNALLDVFASFTSGNGNLTQQTIQLASTGSKVVAGGWLNGSVSIDRTVGNNTSFLVISQTSQIDILVNDPTGTTPVDKFTPDSSSNIYKMDISGTAMHGKWTYSLKNALPAAPQDISITVTSQAVSADIDPVMVNAHISQLSSNGSKPLVVYVMVSQGGVPIILADVRATLTSESGTPYDLDVQDNGAGDVLSNNAFIKGQGADAIMHDGIYSKYFLPKEGGRYSLKVKVENDEKARLSFKRHSGALYIPGYVEEDGSVVLNPPRPPVSEEDQQADVGSFSRTALGESFSVAIDPAATVKFPPNQITDLRAVFQNETVLLTWTAPGDELDVGTAKAYEIRFSEDPELLRSNFSDATALNVSGFQPHESGFPEQHSFDPDMSNGTTLFFAAKAEAQDALSSEISNFAQVTKFVPKAPVPPTPTGANGVNIMAIVIAVTTVTLVACFVASVTMCALKRKRDRHSIRS